MLSLQEDIFSSDTVIDDFGDLDAGLDALVGDTFGEDAFTDTDWSVPFAMD